MSIKRMKWSVCQESSSSSDEDSLPILPETSSSSSSSLPDLSTIEESHFEGCLDSDSSFNSASSHQANVGFASSSKYQTLVHENPEQTHVAKRSNQGEETTAEDVCKGAMTKVETKANADENQNNSPNDAPPNVIVSCYVQRKVLFSLKTFFVCLPQIEITPNDPAYSETITDYHQTKNFAQGLMNLALLAANANQLKYLMESAEQRPLFYISLAFIITSLFVQIMVKICLAINYRFNMNDHVEARRAVRFNNFITFAILVVTLINLSITGIIFAEVKGFSLQWARWNSV
jgi:Ninjurin